MVQRIESSVPHHGHGWPLIFMKWYFFIFNPKGPLAFELEKFSYGLGIESYEYTDKDKKWIKYQSFNYYSQIKNIILEIR